MIDGMIPAVERVGVPEAIRRIKSVAQDSVLQRTEGPRYTVGEVVDGMKRAAKQHLVNSSDRTNLLSMDEGSWIQLAVGAMLVVTKARLRSE